MIHILKNACFVYQQVKKHLHYSVYCNMKLIEATKSQSYPINIAIEVLSVDGKLEILTLTVHVHQCICWGREVKWRKWNSKAWFMFHLTLLSFASAFVISLLNCSAVAGHDRCFWTWFKSAAAECLCVPGELAHIAETWGIGPLWKSQDTFAGHSFVHSDSDSMKMLRSVEQLRWGDAFYSFILFIR